MGFKSVLNMASKFHNKILLSVLSIGILFVLVIENFNPLEFSDFNLNLVIVLWSIFFLISLLYSVNGIVLHKGFLHQIKESENQGKPIKGMRGYDKLLSSLENARNTSILISLASFLSLVVFISSMMDIGLFSEAGRNTIVTIAVSMTFLTTTVVFLVEYPREASMEPGSLIGYYEPEIYPMILDNILSDAFKTFLDPISLMAYDDWVSFIGEHLEHEFEPDLNSNTRLERAVEKILLLSYLSQTMPNIVNEDTIATEISEVIGNHNLDGLYEGAQSGLSWDEIRSMILLMEEQCPDVLRLVDRIIIELQENYDDFTSRDTYFTVSGKTSQGTIRDVSGAIVFLLNNTKNEERKICVEFRSDMSSVHPEYQKMNIMLDPMKNPYPEQKPQFIDVEEDMLSIVNDLLQIGDAVWFRFKSSSFGYKALTFQAEEVATGLTFGRSVEMRFKKSILWYVKTFAPRLSAFGGVLLPVIQASLFA